MRNRRAGSDNYKPTLLRTCGSKPACLVNASVTYCGNNQIYAFGGFDQYTDEGRRPAVLPELDVRIVTDHGRQSTTTSSNST